MPKADLLEFEGTVQDMNKGWYKIQLNLKDQKQEGPPTVILACLAGKLRQHHIRVLPGDNVKVSVSPYDMTHGIITYRGK